MTLSRRRFLRWLAGAGAALGALGPGLRVTRAASQGHEDLVDDPDGFAMGAFEGCHLESGGIVANGTAGFTSRELVADERFTHVGVRWEAEGGGEGLTVALRTRSLRGSWSGWRQLRVERRNGESPAVGTFAALVFSGENARILQYRIEFSGGRVVLKRVVASVLRTPTVPLRRVRALLATSIGAGPSPQAVPVKFRQFLPQIADDALIPNGDATHASDPWHDRLLEVVPRESWHADESLRFGSDGDELWHEMFIPVRALVVHHAGTRNGYDSPEAAAADVRSIYYYHSVIQGWHDIGYNALIDRFGNIYEGRHGRGGDPADQSPREVLSDGVSAGHVHQHNYGSAGVVLLGDSTVDSWTMAAPEGPMWDALVRYCSFEASRAGLRVLDSANPGAPATSDFLRSDNTWHDGIPNLGGHRDSEQTYCPGDAVLALLPALRLAVDASLSALSRRGLTLVRTEPATRELTPGTRVSYRWAASPPDRDWELVGFEYAVEAWFKPMESDDVSYLSGYTAEAQPRLAWTNVSPDQRELSFVALQPGQYTMHLRALMLGAAGLRPATFEAHDSLLVRAEPTSP